MTMIVHLEALVVKPAKPTHDMFRGWSFFWDPTSFHVGPRTKPQNDSNPKHPKFGHLMLSRPTAESDRSKRHSED